MWIHIAGKFGDPEKSKKRNRVYSKGARGWMMFVEKEQPRIPIGPEYAG